tara:strand:+ start:4581 stop:4841 length:261 start_codon:yes stop_codon:yes gene_type:complete
MKTIKKILNENGLKPAKVYRNNSYYNPIVTVYQSGYTRSSSTTGKSIYFYGVNDNDLILKICEDLNENGYSAVIGNPDEIILNKNK